MPHAIARLDHETVLEMCRRRRAREKVETIADELGVARSIVQKWTSHIPVAKRGLLIDDILARADAGEDVGTIAEGLRCPISVVVSVLRARAREAEAGEGFAREERERAQRAEVRAQRARRRAEDREVIERLERGESQSSIARAMGSRAALRRVLHRRRAARKREGAIP